MDPDGRDTNSGLSPDEAVATLDRAYDVALSEGRDWILLAQGNHTLANGFEEGVHLAGGYDADADWSRDRNELARIELEAYGEVLTGWRAATMWAAARHPLEGRLRSRAIVHPPHPRRIKRARAWARDGDGRPRRRWYAWPGWRGWWSW
ncbi:MAG: hypothetical protein IPG17_24640 [Sandaracinaceae bacterium]|nr:hypothetical protein [Sandaracinaceae bacterium]